MYDNIGRPERLCANVVVVAILNDADIEEAIRESIHLASSLPKGTEVTFGHRGILVTVRRDSKTDRVYQAWRRVLYSSAPERKVVGPYPAEEEASSAQSSQAQPIPA